MWHAAQVQNEFVETFLHNNRLDHLVQVLGYHPQYLDCFLKTQHHLLRGDGPLPFDYRHYIAIMVSRACAVATYCKQAFRK